MADTILKVENLSKNIGRKQILKNVSFSIGLGESVGLIGKNGAGKTSILKCIVGLWKYKKGSIYFFAKDISSSQNKYLNEVGALIGYPSLFEDMTLQNNIEYFGCFCKFGYLKEAKRLLKLLSLEDNLNQKVKSFSSGMKQKACLLIAVMKKPKLLILDEPTSMLDPKSSYDIRKFLQSIRSKNCSIIISSHNLSEIEGLCDKVIIIDNGQAINEISLGTEQKRLYVLEMESVEDAISLHQKSKTYTTFLDGKKLHLHCTAKDFVCYITDIKPVVVDIFSEGRLDSIFNSENKGNKNV